MTTLTAAAAALRRGEESCASLVEESLARIHAGRSLNAFLAIYAEDARSRAAELDSELRAGRDRGPLHGIPIALKDNLYKKGQPATSGSRILEKFVPKFDATVVRKLEAAGAVVMGKTNLHELAYGITSSNPHYGPVRNPCDETRIPGGSSGGSGAAVAAGMVFAALGTDTGGSIRIPAAYCGTVGLKPTFGRVSKYGCQPLGLTLDHIGPLTRCVEDAAILLNAMAGYDAADPNCSRLAVEDYRPSGEPSLQGVRIGRPANFYFEKLQPAVAASVERALAAAAAEGATIVPVRVPDIAALNTVSRVILLAEASAVFEPYLADRAHIGKDILAMLDAGRLLAATDYVQAQRLRLDFVKQFEELFGSIDVLATPTIPITAPAIGDTTVEVGGQAMDVRLASTMFMRGINATGNPAISIPCGRDERGLPVGLQLIAAPFAEKKLLETAAALEAGAINL